MTDLRVFAINTCASSSYLNFTLPPLKTCKKTLIFAVAHTLLSVDEKGIIHRARKSLHINNQQTWVKRDRGLLDVTMGVYDGAEVCELVGNYLL